MSQTKSHHDPKSRDPRFNPQRKRDFAPSNRIAKQEPALPLWVKIFVIVGISVVVASAIIFG